ncbi:MAG: hypothetical protein LC792_08510, partial [Actinobacteria bacterium]|nr:hypothetical protein [Actinomycetota bacterium]
AVFLALVSLAVAAGVRANSVTLVSSAAKVTECRYVSTSLGEALQVAGTLPEKFDNPIIEVIFRNAAGQPIWWQYQFGDYSDADFDITGKGDAAVPAGITHDWDFLFYAAGVHPTAWMELNEPQIPHDQRAPEYMISHERVASCVVGRVWDHGSKSAADKHYNNLPQGGVAAP